MGTLGRRILRCARACVPAALLWTLACGSNGGGGSAAGGNNGAGSGHAGSSSGGSNGSGGSIQCGTPNCPAGMQLDFQSCSCVPEVLPLPESGSWHVISSEGAPSPRVGHSVVWTGSEYIVWGGASVLDGGGATMPVNDGGRYDPVGDLWTPTSQTSAPSARSAHKAVWTGSFMAILGQDVDVFPTHPMEGFLYDPEADAWTPMSTSGAPVERAYYDVVSVDGKVVVWGGWLSAGVGTQAFPAASGGVYDPELDSWAPIADAGAPLYDGGHVTLAVEGGFVTYGALSHFLGGDAGHMLAAHYDLASEQWTEIDDATELDPSHGFSTSVIEGGALLSVSTSADGVRCLLLDLPIDGSFTTEELAGSGNQCPSVTRQPALVANGKLVTLDSQLLLELDSHALYAMAPAPLAALTEGRVPAGFTFEGWDPGASASDGQDIFVFGGMVHATEERFPCPDGAPCAAPASMDVALSGALFTP